MLWKKINSLKKNHLTLISILLFVVIFVVTRYPRLNNDIINPDGVNWHYRTQQFVNGLKYFQFEKTYQHYHPGVTLMWVTGIPIELTKVITGEKIYNNTNFELFDFVAKGSLVFVQLLLSLLAIYLLAKITDFKKSLIIVSLFTLEPFFVGNSRLYHLDVLLTLFVFISLLLFHIYVNDLKLFKNPTFDKYTGVLVGLFLTLSFLTKSIGIGAFVYVVVYLLFSYFINKDKNILKKLPSIILSFVGFTFLFFPALWVNPVFYITEIFSEGERVGIRKGHEQIVFGETTTDAGPIFYLLVLLIKLSPFILIGFLSSLVPFYKNIKKDFWNLKNKLKSINWLLGIFYLGYLLVMLFPTKKIDRYMIVLYPLIAYFAYYGYEYLLQKYAKFVKPLLVILFVLFIIYPLFSVFPYYFTYYSPLFINAQNAHTILAQKPFGVGIHDLKDLVVKNYGEVKLGFIDTKPMESIYPASKVFDIRTISTNKYDFIILGPNEEMPEEVLDSKVTFVKDKSLYINGLEYWRIYAKGKSN